MVIERQHFFSVLMRVKCRTCRVTIEEEVGPHDASKASSKTGLHTDARPAASS